MEDNDGISEVRPTPPLPADAEFIASCGGAFSLYFLRREWPLQFQWRMNDGTYRSGHAGREQAIAFNKQL